MLLPWGMILPRGQGGTHQRGSQNPQGCSGWQAQLQHRINNNISQIISKQSQTGSSCQQAGREPHCRRHPGIYIPGKVTVLKSCFLAPLSSWCSFSPQSQSLSSLREFFLALLVGQSGLVRMQSHILRVGRSPFRQVSCKVPILWNDLSHSTPGMGSRPRWRGFGAAWSRPMAVGWNQMVFRVPHNPNCSGIL